MEKTIKQLIQSNTITINHSDKIANQIKFEQTTKQHAWDIINKLYGNKL